MSGKYSRDKGAGGERELAKLLGAEKISGYMKPGNDLEWRGRQIEVKRRSGWPSVMLENWRRDAQIVMFRVDREDWMVYLPLTELLDLLDITTRDYGDTFIDYKAMSPNEQWERIRKMVEEGLP